MADVIVDVDLDRFDGDIAIGMPVVTPVPGGPTAQTLASSVTGQLADGRSLELIQQSPDAGLARQARRRSDGVDEARISARRSAPTSALALSLGL